MDIIGLVGDCMVQVPAFVVASVVLLALLHNLPMAELGSTSGRLIATCTVHCRLVRFRTAQTGLIDDVSPCQRRPVGMCIQKYQILRGILHEVYDVPPGTAQGKRRARAGLPQIFTTTLAFPAASGQSLGTQFLGRVRQVSRNAGFVDIGRQAIIMRFLGSALPWLFVQALSYLHFETNLLSTCVRRVHALVELALCARAERSLLTFLHNLLRALRMGSAIAEESGANLHIGKSELIREIRVVARTHSLARVGDGELNLSAKHSIVALDVRHILPCKHHL